MTRVHVLKKLPIISPSVNNQNGSERVIKNSVSNNNTIYHIGSYAPGFPIEEYHHFPVILNMDNSIWRDATLYLLSKLKSVKTPNYRTLLSIASDLVQFKKYIDAEELDYRKSPKAIPLRPTYSYRFHINDQIKSGEISPQTAKRRMSSVIGFYRYLEHQSSVKFEYPIWQEKNSYISYSNNFGIVQNKEIKITDLKVSVAKNNASSYSDTIHDGGELRPLSVEEQSTLLKALNLIGNSEMTLSFLIALFTGARMQTVFTMRLKHILDFNIDNETGSATILTGPGTGIDTKYGKQIPLIFPNWLILKLQTYAASNRAERRRIRAKYHPEKPNDQYLFLTKSGDPYYIATDDPVKKEYKYPPIGNGIRRFISIQLNPAIKKVGNYFQFSFHDLRATFGLNLLKSCEYADSSSKNDFKCFSLVYIKERMGHNHISTTEAYLNYKFKNEIKMKYQENFEQYLRGIINAQKF